MSQISESEQLEEAFARQTQQSERVQRVQGVGEGEAEWWGPGRALGADLFSDNWEPLKSGGEEQHLLISR